MNPNSNQKPAEVVLVSHEFSPFRGGIATFVREIAVAGTRLGFDLCVWAPEYPRRPQAAEDAAEAFPIRRLPHGARLSPWSIWRLSREFRGRLREEKPAHVVLMSVGAIMAGLLTTGFGTQPLASRVSAVFYGSDIAKLRRRPWWNALIRQRLRRDWRPVCAGQFPAALLRASSWMPPAATIAQSTPAVPSALKGHALHLSPRRLRSATDRFRLLALARLHPRKGQLEAAEAFHFLPQELRQRLRFEIAGTGDPHYRADVIRTTRAAGVECVVHGEIDQDRIGELYAGCDGYIMASRTLLESVEGFGITFLEAGLFRLPVLGYQSGGSIEAVQDGVTGLLAPEGDRRELARLLGRLINEPELADRLGRAGQERAMRSNWEDSANALLSGGK